MSEIGIYERPIPRLTAHFDLIKAQHAAGSVLQEIEERLVGPLDAEFGSDENGRYELSRRDAAKFLHSIDFMSPRSISNYDVKLHRLSDLPVNSFIHSWHIDAAGFSPQYAEIGASIDATQVVYGRIDFSDILCDQSVENRIPLLHVALFDRREEASEIIEDALVNKTAWIDEAMNPQGSGVIRNVTNYIHRVLPESQRKASTEARAFIYSTDKATAVRGV